MHDWDMRPLLRSHAGLNDVIVILPRNDLYFIMRATRPFVLAPMATSTGPTLQFQAGTHLMPMIFLFQTYGYAGGDNDPANDFEVLVPARNGLETTEERQYKAFFETIHLLRYGIFLASAKIVQEEDSVAVAQYGLVSYGTLHWIDTKPALIFVRFDVDHLDKVTNGNMCFMHQMSRGRFTWMSVVYRSCQKKQREDKK